MEHVERGQPGSAIPNQCFNPPQPLEVGIGNDRSSWHPYSKQTFDYSAFDKAYSPKRQQEEVCYRNPDDQNQQSDGQIQTSQHPGKSRLFPVIIEITM